MQNFKVEINNISKISELDKAFENGNIFEFLGFTVKKSCEEHCGSGVNIISHTIKNTGGRSLLLNRLSSFFKNDVAPDFHNKSVVIHTCNFTWQGEGQWQSHTPYELGLYKVAGHSFSHITRSYDSTGSWSTSRMYPMIIIEDKTDGITYGFELEASFGWQIELSTAESGDRLCLTVDCNSANERHNGFCVTLAPGEEFTSVNTLYCEVMGGFTDAVNALLRFKRENGLRYRSLPVAFNDYMNCLWAMPSRERLIPLIDAAADVGAEIFCIDDGWFFRSSPNGSFGDWHENDELFGDGGLKGIIEYIASKGMKPGIWFEIESALSDSDIVKLSPTAVLTRGGKPIKTDKLMLDFRDSRVREYIYRRIKHVYELGVRYIKNDYNQTTGLGCDTENGSAAAGLIEHTAAYIGFIDTITSDFPDLIIENCGSGGMRCDNGMLKHFHLQSISDQEDFTNNPSILRGVLACIPPEKAGVWSYPYPLCFEKRYDADTAFDNEYLDIMSDGEQTAFNMAVGLFGAMNLSGHIEKCDRLNFDLIKKAIDIVKSDREFLLDAYPIFIGEQQQLFHDGFTVLVLKNKKRVRIGVFKNTDVSTVEFELGGKLGGCTELNEIYPKLNGDMSVKIENGKLLVHCDKRLAARVFEADVN